MVKSITFILLFLNTYCFAQDFEIFCAKYDTLTTIAGAGKIREKGQNGWQDKYEGKKAIKAELSRPHFAMADERGNIYIADKDAHAIRKIDLSGNIVTVAGINEMGFNGDGKAINCKLNRPNGIWVQPNGEVFILDLGNSRIRKLTLKGELITIVKDEKPISIGRGLYVNAEEDTIFYASNDEIRLWVKGKKPRVFCDGFSVLGNIIMNERKELIATDRSKGKVYRISMNGERKLIAGGENHKIDGKNLLKEVRAVWPLGNDSYLLGCHAGSKLYYLDANGELFEFLDGKSDYSHKGDGEHFRTPGNKVSEVRSVSLDYQGNIIICENDFGYIRKIRRKN